MEFFYLMCYYVVLCGSIKCIAISTMKFKPGKKWLLFWVQLTLELTPVVILYFMNHYAGPVRDNDFNFVNIWFYLVDIVLVAFWAKGNFIINVLHEFVYCQLWYMFLTISMGMFVLLIMHDVKQVRKCDSWADIGSAIAFTGCSLLVVIVSTMAWKILNLYFRRPWKVLLAGIVLMTPFAVNTLARNTYITPMIYSLNESYAGITMSLFLGLVVILLYLYYRYTVRRSNAHKILLDQSLKTAYIQYGNLAQVVEKNAKWRHDIMNHLQVIEHITNEANNQITRPIVDYTKDVLVKSKSISSGKYTDNVVLDCVLNMKEKLATDNGIQTQMEVFFPRETELSDYELVGLVSNLLDNAIEACEKVEQKKRFIKLYTNCQSNYLCLELVNAKEGGLVPTEKGFLTTKADKKNHGYGTSMIYEIVKKNDGEINYVDEGECLRTEIMIKIG